MGKQEVVTTQGDQCRCPGSAEEQQPAQPEGDGKGQESVHLMPELGLKGQIEVCLDELRGGRLSQAGRPKEISINQCGGFEEAA